MGSIWYHYQSGQDVTYITEAAKHHRVTIKKSEECWEKGEIKEKYRKEITTLPPEQNNLIPPQHDRTQIQQYTN